MKPILLAVIIFVGLLTLSSSLYTIGETEQVIITQFGEPVGTPPTRIPGCT
jgi:modulator of FtsH protease HflC